MDEKHNPFDIDKSNVKKNYVSSVLDFHQKFTLHVGLQDTASNCELHDSFVIMIYVQYCIFLN